jgi:hypothetical protein
VGSVARSTRAGLPWLLYPRRRGGGQVHFRPFAGWRIPAERSAVVEVYPARWSRGSTRDDRDTRQHDAYSIVAWMRDVDENGSLRTFPIPPLGEWVVWTG